MTRAGAFHVSRARRSLRDSWWRDHALCAQVGADVFFPSKGDEHRHSAQAKAVCARCPVQADCLFEALANREEHGVWGGTSPRQRRALRADRGKGRALIEEYMAKEPR